MRYTIEVIIDKGGKMDSPTVMIKSFEMNYTKKDYLRCENEIRDHFVDMANQFIDREFYE